MTEQDVAYCPGCDEPTIKEVDTRDPGYRDFLCRNFDCRVLKFRYGGGD